MDKGHRVLKVIEHCDGRDDIEPVAADFLCQLLGGKQVLDHLDAVSYFLRNIGRIDAKPAEGFRVGLQERAVIAPNVEHPRIGLADRFHGFEGDAPQVVPHRLICP